MKIEIDNAVHSELEYMLTLLKKSNSYQEFNTPQDLINYALRSIADGSCRPGSWEREMINSLGLVANCYEHQIYREEYGEPN